MARLIGMMTMMPEELKRYRKAARHTQAQMAEALRVSQGFVGEMERGEKAIDQRTADWVRALYAPLRPVMLVGGSYDGEKYWHADGLTLMRLEVKNWMPPFVRPGSPGTIAPSVFYRYVVTDADTGIAIFAPQDEAAWTPETAMTAARERGLE